MTDPASEAILSLARLGLAEKSHLSIFLVADIHAYDSLEPSESRPSFVDLNSLESSNPVLELREFVTTKGIKSDLIVFCGDMGDKARPAPARWVWQQLEDLRAQLGAALLLATAGNHDVDSRYRHSEYDAKGLLQQLAPPFPVASEALADRYWSRHYLVLQDTKRLRIVLLNSAAFHGGGRSSSSPEYERGRISSFTLKRLRDELVSSDTVHGGQPGVNILICHHHPHSHGDVEESDTSLMEGC